MGIWQPRWSACRMTARRGIAGKMMATGSSKSYSKTLLLPKTPFQLWLDPQRSEKPFRSKTSQELYEWQDANAKGPLFVLHDGPPYANGSIHIGHAMNKILKDIINRFHVLQGRRVNYIPGWDCHGLPIENKALKELGQHVKQLPPEAVRSAANSVALREMQTQQEEFKQLGIMADWATNGTYRTLDQSYELRQLRIFQRMVERGLIYHQYRPVYYSPSSLSALAEAELVYVDDHQSCSAFAVFKLGIRGADVSRRLAGLLAEEQERGRGVEVMIWTTTPWTLTANMSIAVHPDIEYVAVRKLDENVTIVAKDRVDVLSHVLGPTEETAVFSGSELLDATYEPLFPGTPTDVAPFKIIPASHVTAGSGTGLVHCAPAHGMEDYVAFRELGLLPSKASPKPRSLESAAPETFPLLCHVDKEGKYDVTIVDAVGQEAGEKLAGLSVLGEGALAVRSLLLSSGRIVADECIRHRYPYDWKTNQPVIVTATEQWFANLDAIKDRALTALENVAFYPPSSRTRLTSHVQTRSEWCISRQRVWGVPIPSLEHVPTGRTFLDGHTLVCILAVLQQKGVEHWWVGDVEEFVPPHLLTELGTSADVGKDWRKGTDTMDVWFDSGSSWALLDELGVRSGREAPREAYADICVEGSDQHRGWFQSLLLTSVAAAPTGSGGDLPVLPYHSLFTHGMVLDEAGKKMSKSEGNVISPMDVIHGGKDKEKNPPYGADTLRLWAASVEPWRDVAIGHRALKQTAETLRRLRNCARFILGNIGDVEGRMDFVRAGKSDLSIADRYIMHELYKLEQLALEGFASYNFTRIVNAVTNFANTGLSAFYFDITKDILYAEPRDSTQRRAVVTVLEKVLETMTSIIAPIVPHLAEEIHYFAEGSRGGKGDGPSVFTRRWVTLSSEWEDASVAKDMTALLSIRDTVLSLLENARSAKQLRSSLEAEVDLFIPSGLEETHLGQVLIREEDFLKTLFIVSDAFITDEGALGTDAPEWVYSGSVSIEGIDEDIGIRVLPASLEKCPRCWTFTREHARELCDRCANAVSALSPAT